MNKITIAIVLIIAFFISFYDFIFTPFIASNQEHSAHYSPSGSASYYGNSYGNYNNGKTIRGKSSNHWQRGLGSKGK